MTDNTREHGRTALRPRRLALLGSVAAIGAAMIIAGPGGYLPMPWSTTSAHAADAASTPASAPAGFANLVAKVKPAVVSVRVKIDETANTADMSEGNQGNEGSEGNDREVVPFAPGSPMEKFFQQFGEQGMPNGMQRHHVLTGEGSGFFITADGYAVTNNHVVDHAKSVQVTTDDGTVYTAKVIGTDPKTDIALIKVDGKNDFPFVKFAQQTPRVGDWVVAVGNPFGLGGTVTAGIVSARGRDIGAGAYDDYIQIDAPINKGNSGGPAFDVNGEVIGVNTAIYSPSGGSVGIGFDVPAETAKMVVAQLKEHGHVTRGWLGVEVQPVTANMADSLGLKKAEGVIVDERMADSPAAKAGLENGDVITAVNGKPIKDAREFARTIGGLAPNSSVKFDVVRNGATKSLTATLATMPSEHTAQAETASPDAANTPHLGVAVEPARDRDGSGQKGVVVTQVEPDSPAAQGGIQPGDVILDVNGKQVSSAADVRKAMADAKDQGKHGLLMRVKTAKATLFIAVPFGKA
jgi:serine protease Do